MPAIDAAVLVAILALSWLWLVRRKLDEFDDPAYLREHGVVIASERALQDHSSAIGEYLGRPIWGSVTFKGMQYRFHRLQERGKREQLAPRELFLEPGLVYVTDREFPSGSAA